MVDFFLEQNFTEEQSFWFMVYIIEKLLHPQFYSSFFPLFADIKFFKVMLFHLNNEVFNSLMKNQMDLFFILHKWLFMHFMDISNHSLVSWFMDFFLIESEVATMKTAMIFFVDKPQKIIGIKSIQNLKSCLQEMIQTINDEIVFKKLYKKFFLSEELYTYGRKILIQKEKGSSVIKIIYKRNFIIK